MSEQNLSHSLSIYTGGHYYGDVNWSRNRNHCDNCLIVYYLVQGEITVIHDGKRITITSGRLYIINGYLINRFETSGSFEQYWFHVVPQSPYFQRAITELSPVIEVEHSRSKIILPYLFNIEKLLAPGRLVQIDFVRLEANILLLVLEEIEVRGIQIEKKEQNTLTLEKAMNYIEEHLDQEISLSELAKHCSLSVTHFHRIFTLHYKITPQQYILQAKMKLAKNLLAGSNLTIKEVTYRAGFVDQAYFARCFKKYYYLTPSQYRKESTCTTSSTE